MSRPREGAAARQRIPAVVFVVGYAFLLMCIPSQLIVGPIGAPGTPANLWALGGLLWWCCATVGGWNPHRTTPVRLAAGLLALAVVAAYVSGTTHGYVRPGDIVEVTNDVYDYVPVSVDSLNTVLVSAADRGLLSFGGWLGLVLLTVDGLRSWRDLERVAAWVSWLGAFVATLGIIQFVSGLDIASFFTIPGLTANSQFGAVSARSILHRPSSTAVHPIEFGVVMAAVLPLALHRLFRTRGAGWSWVPVVLVGLAIPMSVSRSAVLTVAVALLILLVGWPRRRRIRALLVLPVAVVAVRIAVPGLVGTIASLFSNFANDPSITGRTDDYTTALEVWGEHPWIGRGLFTFAAEYYRILDNQFLVALIEVGVLGVLAMVTLFVVGFLCARGARRRTPGRHEKDLCLALSGSIAGIVLSYATFDAWSFPMAAGVTFLLVGLAGAAWRLSVQEAAPLSSQEVDRVAAS